jgi:hypothetical protein
MRRLLLAFALLLFASIAACAETITSVTAIQAQSAAINAAQAAVNLAAQANVLLAFRAY